MPKFSTQFKLLVGFLIIVLLLGGILVSVEDLKDAVNKTPEVVIKQEAVTTPTPTVDLKPTITKSVTPLKTGTPSGLVK